MTVKGRVLNPITGEGISNVPVIMYRSTLDYPSGSKRVKETTTDSDGYFEISKASLSKCYLTCHTTDVGDYYPIGWEKKDDVPLFDAFTISVKKGKTMHADYYAVPYGSLTLNIKNTSCFNSFDNIKIYFDGGPYDSRTFNPGLMTSLDGCIDIPGSPVKSSMGYKYFHWEVTKNSVTTTYYDTVFVNEGLTTILNVNY
ncbi:hypothetical protein [Fluviicola chungangensis]|nr:hypothetical protein [Fluviicola chungangensis]